MRKKLHGLLFQSLKEIALNTAHVDQFESADLVFPLHEDAFSVQNVAVPGNGDHLPGDEFTAGLQRVLRRPL